jgi:hypothetical protein
MIDIVSLSLGIVAVIVAITTHIKFSKCWGFEMATRTPPNSPHIIETQPLLQNSPAILQPYEDNQIPSEPINIENKRKVIKNWL